MFKKPFFQKESVKPVSQTSMQVARIDLWEEPFSPRRLHNWVAQGKNTPSYEVVIGGKAAALGTLCSLKEHPKNAHRNVLFFTERSHLQMIHPHYDDSRWGQKISGLPPMMSAIAKNVLNVKGVSKDRELSWGDARQLENALMEKTRDLLEENFYDDKIVKISADGQVQLAGGKIIHLGHDTHYYNFSRVTNAPNLSAVTASGFPRLELPLEGIQTTPHEVLYFKHPNEVDSIFIVVGNGPSTQWLIREHPEAKIVVVRKSNSEWPNIPGNSKIDMSHVVEIIYEDSRTTLYRESDGCIVVGGFDTRHQKTFDWKSEPDAPVYAAAGYRYCSELTADLPAAQKTELLSPQIVVTPKDVPVGSFMNIFYQVVHATDNLNLLGYRAIHFDSKYKAFLTQKMAGHGFQLNERYFDAIEKSISKLASAPTEQHLGRIIKTAYRQALLPEERWEEFRQLTLESSKSAKEMFATQTPKAPGLSRP